MGVEQNKSLAAAILGRVKSPAKTQSSRENGKLGGRPRKLREGDFGLPILEMATLEREFMKTNITIADLVRKTMTLLEGQEILIIGGLVLHKYARPRATYDLDLVVLSSKFDATGALLIKNGYISGKEFEYDNPTRSIHKFSYREREVDLIEYSDAKFAAFLFETAKAFTVFGVTAQVVSPEGFILTKLIAANAERGGKSPATEFIGQDFIDIKAVSESITVDWSTVDEWVKTIGLSRKMKVLKQYLGR